MPSCLTSAAATSSCVLSGLEAQSRTSAPPALSVFMRLAVSVVTCRQAVTRIPLNGLFSLKSFLDEPQHRHGGLGPFNLEFSLVC